MNNLESSSSFYSTPNPANIGSPTPNKTNEDRTFANVIDMPDHATPPPYDRSAEAESFAPHFNVSDPTMQAQVEPMTESTGIPLPLIAAGIFALWLLFKGNK